MQQQLEWLALSARHDSKMALVLEQCQQPDAAAGLWLHEILQRRFGCVRGLLDATSR